jgi:DNA (cytosine-5)-methyltransferase 1
MSGRTVLSLFTGAGGFDLGLEVAGFVPVLCVEVDPDSRETLSHNRPSWPLSQPGDVHQITPNGLLRQTSLKPRQLTLLAGGPPCQPFSKSVQWSTGDTPRLRDPRARTLLAYLRVVEVMQPQVLILENVKGFTFDGKDEGWRLLENGLNAINRKRHTAYVPQIITLNAADYGVPQVRERVFLIASIDGKQVEMPEASHGSLPDKKPYVTAWDVLAELDHDEWPSELNASGRWARLLPSIPEGMNYLWHTPRNLARGGMPLFGWRTRFWSFLLKLAKRQPSWTIQADPGPATGPFHWKSRLLSVEEMCRLQTFPRRYQIIGSRRSAQRQVGNAVPSAIGELLGREIRRQLLGERVGGRLHLIPTRRSDCPAPEPIARVPREYLNLRARHRDHPGTGGGPSARRRENQRRTLERVART